MSAGNFFGLIMNTVFFAGLWTILGAAIDKMGQAFNSTIGVIPTYQDAINGFTMQQTFWVALPILYFIFLCVNYVMNENSKSSGDV